MAEPIPAPSDLDPDLDPHRWLEDVLGEAPLAWVRERNAVTETQLTAHPKYAATRAALLDVLNAHDRIPYFVRRGEWLYNFWQDEQHKRGLWRRTRLDSYRRADPEWDLLLDLDALAEAEGENWTWGGTVAHGPAYARCLVLLSRGGADAKTVREFDLVARRFVPDGFFVDEAKTDVEWIDDDTLYIGTDFGPGSMTDSGYPRIVKRWSRGTPLADAVTVFEGERSDVSVSVNVDDTPGHARVVFSRAIDFYTTQTHLLRRTPDGDTLVPLDLPPDAVPHFMRDSLLLTLRSELQHGGQTFPSGALLETDAEAFLAGTHRWQALFTPTATRSLDGYTCTRDHLVLNVMDDVANRLEEWRKDGHHFTHRAIEAPYPGSLSASALHDPLLGSDDPLAEHYLLTYTDFLTPDSLFLARTGSDERELLKSRSNQFDARGMRVEQRFASSPDGTRVPYFVVWPRDARADGRNPTLLYGYGGFEIALNPWYSGGFGRAWFEGGGVMVVANIRGGGEYGPAWHQAAVKQHKQRSYDDFIAVAEDLVRQRITAPQHLGIVGGSNGGLLVGAALTQRPELFNAVVCQVPLLDMRHYHQLLAGASWMAEYGDPDDPQAWEVIRRYSPYHNVRADQRYPKVLLTTSTRDDRVHPGHARKMAARLLAQGHDVLYYENIEGGHAGAADNDQRAHLQALEFSYLWQQLGHAPEAHTP